MPQRVTPDVEADFLPELAENFQVFLEPLMKAADKIQESVFNIEAQLPISD